MMCFELGLEKPNPKRAVQCAITISALFVFGFIKGKSTGAGSLKSALQTALIGGLAAAFGIARAIS